MNIIMYYPKRLDDIRELEKRVAAVHAQAVIQKIESIPCSKVKKERLVDAIIKEGGSVNGGPVNSMCFHRPQKHQASDILYQERNRELHKYLYHCTVSITAENGERAE